jgi:hypothetical protein
VFSIGSYPLRVYQVLQHASTALGTAFVAWWAWRAYKVLPVEDETCIVLPGKTKFLVVSALVAVSAAWAALDAALPGTLNALELRLLLRGAGLDAAQALVVGVLAYCAATTWLLGRNRAPRSPAGR